MRSNFIWFNKNQNSISLSALGSQIYRRVCTHFFSLFYFFYPSLFFSLLFFLYSFPLLFFFFNFFRYSFFFITVDDSQMRILRTLVGKIGIDVANLLRVSWEKKGEEIITYSFFWHVFLLPVLFISFCQLYNV